MSKKNKGQHPFNTGDDFLNLARARGAVVEKAGRFWKVKTPAGTAHIAGGTEKLDDQTVSNLKRWFRLLGLMILLGVLLVDFLLHLFGYQISYW